MRSTHPLALQSVCLQSLSKRMARWNRIKVSPQELKLENTLPAGQSFRWCRRSSARGWVGVCSRRMYALCQEESSQSLHWKVLARARDAHPERDEHTLLSTLSLRSIDPSLVSLHSLFEQHDKRYRRIRPFLEGARVMRQDALETLLAFICSSNNNIARISQLVESLCVEYGDSLDLVEEPEELESACADAETPSLRAFPRFETLHRSVDEHRLRDKHFGYRAKYIFETVHTLAQKMESNNDEHGGAESDTSTASRSDSAISPEEWLHRLRDEYSYKDAHAELAQLPGVGPKVASCICLFALNKPQAIPVDTHVWRIAQQHYKFKPTNKSLTPKAMEQVEESMRAVFGEYCGWALNVLFAAELARYRDLLPKHLQTARVGQSSSSSPSEEGDDEAEDQSDDKGKVTSQDAAHELAETHAAESKHMTRSVRVGTPVPKKKKRKRDKEDEG